MSNRTLIEINHDFCREMTGDAFVLALERYVRSACRETAKDLEHFGVRVIAMRHHSGKFLIEGRHDGFPAEHIEP